MNAAVNKRIAQCKGFTFINHTLLYIVVNNIELYTMPKICKMYIIHTLHLWHIVL